MESNVDLEENKVPFTQAEIDAITYCANCKDEFGDVFILCNVCEVHICLACMARGVQFGPHESDHEYKVINSNYILFLNGNWTSREELVLLNGLLTHNNFRKIAKELPRRSYKEIIDHYNDTYLSQGGTELFADTRLRGLVEEPLCVPYRVRITNVRDPLRDDDNMPAGYNAVRSDFVHNYDRYAEAQVTRLEDIPEDDVFYEVLTNMQLQVVMVYRRKLQERARRMKILKEHGLIMQQKIVSWQYRHRPTILPSLFARLVRFMQFYTGQGFEKLITIFHKMGLIKLRISRLCDYRKNGIMTFDQAKIYLKLKQEREESQKEIKRFQQLPEINLRSNRHSFIPAHLHPLKKRTTTPLDIVAMPSYEKLLPNERELCSQIRLMPMQYIELKNTLVHENNKFGYLKLLTARKLLKIDVNKTRKLYDFLIQEGHIAKPRHS